MSNPFFDHPVINSPYKYPSRHWELDETGQPTQKIMERRRSAEFITPIPKPRKRKKQADQASLFVSELSTKEQEYDHTALINGVRKHNSRKFTRGFLVVTPGITIRDRLRVLMPNDPLSIPVELQTALQALYGHYAKTYQLWKQAGVTAPPCFIVVCNNTATSKLVYDYISGFVRTSEDGTSNVVNGRLELFRNYDEHDNPLPWPNTLLIDSEQLESGEALDKDFRNLAGEIKRGTGEKTPRKRRPPWTPSGCPE